MIINRSEEELGVLSQEDLVRLSEIDSILLKDPRNIKLLLEKGFILHDGALDDKAVNVYKEILKIDPKNLKAYIWLCESLWMLCNYVELKRIAEEALKIYPNQAEIYNFLADAIEDEYFRQSKEIQEPCFSYIRRAIELAPDWISPRITLIQFLINIKDFKSALYETQEAFKYVNNDFPIPKDPMEYHYERFITRRIEAESIKKSLNNFLDEINSKITEKNKI